MCVGPIIDLSDLGVTTCTSRKSLFFVLLFLSPLRLLLLSLLSHENPFASSPVISQSTGETRIPQSETLVTIQDWLWHKLLSIFGFHVSTI